MWSGLQLLRIVSRRDLASVALKLPLSQSQKFNKMDRKWVKLARDSIRRCVDMRGFEFSGHVTRESVGNKTPVLCVKGTAFILHETWQHCPPVTEGFIYLYRLL